MDDITSTQSIWPYYAKQNVDRAAANTQSDSLGRDDFMKLLVAQLSNQDPLQPMDDKEFISQMAQFSSLEQTMNMADEIKQMRQSLGFSSSLIGKTVTWMDDSDPGTDAVEKSGTVSAIVMKDDALYAKIGEDEIPLEQLTSVADAQDDAGVPDDSGTEDGADAGDAGEPEGAQ